MNTKINTTWDKRDLRNALGSYGTGVTVVTACGADGQRAGLTVNSFNSVSLEPPLVLWSLGRSSSSMAVFAAASHQVIHVLGADQQALGERLVEPGDAPRRDDAVKIFGVPIARLGLLDAIVERLEVRRLALDQQEPCDATGL